MKIIIPTLFVLAWFLPGATIASEEVKPQPARVRTLKDLEGCRVGIMAGTILDAAAEKHLAYAQLRFYDDYYVMEDALRDGDIEALMGDYTVLRAIAAGDPHLRVLEGAVPGDSYGFGFRYQDKELYGRFNAMLGRLANAGYVETLRAKWVEGPPENREMPEPEPRGSGDELVMGTCAVSPPFTYPGPEGAIIGMDIELASQIASRMGRRLKVVNMEFCDLIPSLVAGKVDFIGACVSITPERLDVINFTDGYFRTGVGAMVWDSEPAEAPALATTEKNVVSEQK